MSTAQDAKASSLRKREADPTPATPDAHDVPPATCGACNSAIEEAALYCSQCGWAINENRAFDIDDDELENFLFHGFVKRKFSFFSDKVVVELRTLQAGDYNKISRHMGEYAGGRRSIQADYANEDRLVTLSHALVSWMGKEIKDVETGRAALEACAEGLLELVQDRFNRLILGVDKVVKQELRVKNS